MDNVDTPPGYGKGMHLAHLNVRSMFGGKKFDMLKKQIEMSVFDIFTISESWLSKSIPSNMINVPGYSITRYDRTWTDSPNGVTRKGGGLVTYVGEGIKFSESKFDSLNISCADLKMQWIALDLENVRPIVVINVYRPPQGDYKTCCKLITEAVMTANLKDSSEIYLMGDFNIDFEGRKSPAVRELEFTTKSLNLTQLITSPTRYYFREGNMRHSKLDIIFSNSEFVNAARVVDINISDHQAVMVTRKKVHITIPKN